MGAGMGPAIYALLVAGGTAATRYGPALQTAARNLQARGAVLSVPVMKAGTEVLITDGAVLPHTAAKMPERAQMVKDAVKKLGSAKPVGEVLRARDFQTMIMP